MPAITQTLTHCVEHSQNCRCFDCKKEVVVFKFNGAVSRHEMVVIRTELGNHYMDRHSYEGPVLTLV